MMKTLKFMTRSALSIAALAIILTPAFTPDALAQVPDSATSIANPGRVQERFDKKEFNPGVLPKVQVKDPILQNVPEGAENIKFELVGVQIDGMTVYQPADIMPLYKDYLGRTISLADAYAIATKLTNKYRNDGYILTQVVIPPQTIEGGIVRFQAVEGFIDRITVESSEEDQSGLGIIQSYASHISTGQALNIRDLERNLLLINDLAGVTARSVLSPSESTPGAADLRIIIQRDNFDAFASADNYGSRFLGPLQATLGGNANSLFDLNGRLSGQIVHTPVSKELTYLDLAYEMPVGSYGTKIRVSASHTDTEPGIDLEILNVQGKSRYYNIQATHPFIRSRTENLTGYLVFDSRKLESSNILTGLTTDRIRAIRAGAQYEFLDTLFGAGINSINLELARGLNIFGASREGDSRMTRTAGDPQFFKANMTVQRLQRVTSSVNVLASVRGQMSNGALLSSEEFGIGGIGLGRGFDPSEIIGDQGVAGQIEVQWNDPVKIQSEDLKGYQLFSFFDGGSVWEDDPSTRKQKRDTITSAGFGTRVDFANDIEADLTVAFPLNREVEAEGNDDARVFFSLSKDF